MSMRAENAFPMTVKKKIVGKKIALFPTNYVESVFILSYTDWFWPRQP